MANRFIESNMWNDSKFADDFTPEDKYFWLMLLTTRYGNLAGCFEFSIKQMSKDSGYNVETIEKLIGRFIKEHKMIDYDYETKEILILNWHKYNWTKSPKFEVSLKKYANEIKNEKFRKHIISSYKDYTSDTVSIPYRYDTSSISISSSIRDSISNRIDLKETSKEKGDVSKSDTSVISKNKKFIKPNLQDIIDYLRFYYIDEKEKEPFAEAFIDHYETVGWKVGKTTMKDWKASVRTWTRNKRIERKPDIVIEIEIEKGFYEKDN